MVSSGDVRRLFLQSVLSRGVLSEKLARTIWVKCADVVRGIEPNADIPNPDSQESWDKFVTSVNESLDELDFDFKLCQDELNGKKMYALVNRKDDEVAQMATDYNHVEIAYFKAIVEQIMLAPRESYSVSSLAALREASEIKPKSNMSKTQAETVLGSFVAKGWLLKSKRGRYSLSTRTMLELGGYLKTTYPDEIIECVICQEMITKGIACLTQNCQVRMHLHCFTVCRRKRATCPACSVNWPADPKDPLILVGEDAARGDDGKRRVRARTEDEEEGEEDPSQDQSQSQPTQPKRVKKGKASKKIDSDEEEEEEPEYDDEDEDDAAAADVKPKRRSQRK